MTRDQEKELEKNIRTWMNKTYNEGLVAGARGICKGILQIINEDMKSATAEEKLQRIIQFCGVGAGEETQREN